MTTQPESPEQMPLNVEIAERQAAASASAAPGATPSKKSTVNEMRKNLQKPTIGISLIIFLISNGVMLLIGALTLNECPLKTVLPIYLVVAGSLGIITKIIPIVNRNKQLVLLNRLLVILFLVEFIWMILGSYWVYSINPSYDPNNETRYCNKTTYLFAFWWLTITYIFLGILLILYICAACIACSLRARIS